MTLHYNFSLIGFWFSQAARSPTLDLTLSLWVFKKEEEKKKEVRLNIFVAHIKGLLFISFSIWDNSPLWILAYLSSFILLMLLESFRIINIFIEPLNLTKFNLRDKKQTVFRLN